MPRLTIRLTDEDAARLEAVVALQGMTRAERADTPAAQADRTGAPHRDPARDLLSSA